MSDNITIQTKQCEDIRNKLNIVSKDFFISVGLSDPFIVECFKATVDVAVSIALTEEEMTKTLEVYPSLRRTKIYYQEQVDQSIFDKVYCNYINKNYFQDCIKLAANNGLVLFSDVPNKTCLNEFMKKNTKKGFIVGSWYFPNIKNDKRYDLLLKIKKV